MESEEITKLVDGIYKNILDKFNPGTRQMINAGKAYLKALHGAAAASRIYVDAITKLARQAQQSTWSGCSDIGAALMQIVEVYKETQVQQMNILKAFYVDVLVPLETNLEKDTKVVQCEQKRFVQNHKQHIDSYSKAESTVKKYRKKQGRGSKNTNMMDKELKSMQALEDEKNKLDEFCEKSLKHAMIQERRRYGFVLERQTSLMKHNNAFYEKQQLQIEKYINNWNDISNVREKLPENVDNMFTSKLRQMNFYPDEQPERSLSPEQDDDLSLNSQLRKSRSVDSACIESQSNGQEMLMENKTHGMVKAKSEYNVNGSSLSLQKYDECTTIQRPKSMAIPESHWENDNLVRALYSYLSNGENQLSFLKGDIISVIGDRNKGWQYGENLRTRSNGWFPNAYTEAVVGDETLLNSPRKYRNNSFLSKNGEIYGNSTTNGDTSDDKITNMKFNNKQPAVHKFGDSVVQRHPYQGRRAPDNPFNPIPPPVMPAPIIPANSTMQRDPHASPAQNGNAKKTQNGNASLHSSNDSGFSNDPPPAPDVDYSDDEAHNRSDPRKPDKATTTKPNGINEWLHDRTNYSATMYDKKRHVPLRQSSSVGHLVTLGRVTRNDKVMDKKIKRTKSLWKFRKDDVLEGMALWKHRSLVDINDNHRGGTPVMEKRMTLTREISVDSDDENGTLIESNRYENGRYSDVESDQESCIVVDDHRKADTISAKLPRTRLTKGNEYDKNDDSSIVFESAKLQNFKYNKGVESSWYDSWGERRKK